MKETVDFSKLVDRALQNDKSAFDELYLLTVKTAYATAELFLKNDDDIQDVLQNTYLKAFQKLSDLNDPNKFEIWIKAIVENECKNYIIKEKRVYAPIKAVIEEKTEESIDEWDASIPQEYIEKEDLRKNVTDMLHSLSPEICACMVLFYYEERSLIEISEILDIPVNTVKTRLHYGRKKFEKKFNKLRKKDPTLYSFGAIPVLLSVLSYQTKNVVVPAALSETVLAVSTGASTATATASSAAGAAAGAATSASATAAGGVATTAATSIAVKITAVAVAGAVTVGGSATIKNYIENKEAAENTTVHSSLFQEVEMTTFAEPSTEVLTFTDVSSQPLTVVLSTTKPITTTAASVSASEHTTETETIESHAATKAKKPSTTETKKSTTERETTTAKPTTTKPTTTKPTTTKPTTTKPTTTKPTTTKPTTTKPTTTKPTTAKPTTTTKPTTNPENNYGASGGVLTEYTGSESSITIPSSLGSSKVTAIGAGAFSGNTSIKSVSIPSSVTQIGQEAFSDCTSLTSVSLPSSLQSIGIGAFYGCTSLSSVSVPDGTKTISDEAFAQCSSLKTITIPSSVTTIADDAFSGCDSLNIRCEEGSAAHSFAELNGISYTLI